MTRRYRNFDQLRSVVAKEAKNRPFCLAYAPGDTRLDVYWSDAVRRSGEPHDAAVNCIQALHAGRSSAYRLGIVVYRAGDYWGYMPQGMLEFVGDFKGDPGAAINATIEVNLEKCEKRTEALPQFNPAGLGPAPNVDLKVEARTGQRGSERAVHRLYMMLAFALVQSRVGKGDEGHNIGTVLVAPDGLLLGWGLNTVSKNYTFHAELNAIQQFYHRTNQPLPEGCRIYTTLKPCRMCAGMIRDAADKPETLRVFFAQDDQSTGKTALDGLPGVQRLLGEGGSACFQRVSFVISQAKALRLERLRVQSDAATRLAMGWQDSVYKYNQRTAYLKRHETPLDVFKSASGRLLEKIDKYTSDLQFGNPVVRRVLEHIYPFVQQMGIMAAGPAPAFGAQLALVAEDFFNSLKPEDWDSIDKVSNEHQMNL
jgi:tRNA(Arg) A34 adenosine deaminase TadA